MKGAPIPVRSPEYLSTDANKNTRSYKQYHQNRLDKKKKKALNGLSEEDEITRFLEMQVALEVENPLEWWEKNTQDFPILSQLVENIWLYPQHLWQVNVYSLMLEALFLLLEIVLIQH